MDETSYLSTSDRVVIKFDHLSDSIAVDSNNPALVQHDYKPLNGAKSTGPKKILPLSVDSTKSVAKRKGKMLALDMSQVSTAITAVDDDEPRSCDVAIQSSYADNQCSKVTEFLFVGSENVARQKELLLEKGITHIVNCSGATSPNFYEDTFSYMTLKLNDSPKEDVLQLFKQVVAYITKAVESGGRVFIHCQRGVSRGPTIALSYLMWQRHLSYEEAYPLMKSARSVCCPNPGFVFQLLEWEHQCKTFSPSPSPGGYNRVAEFPDSQPYKSADIRLLSRDKVSCS
jgi:protein-tyrosine phosphatase